ncbi:NupC/NupG family nucleoside CNT transporter [Pseudalkalibacillus decolorationis]|uniref:NupC/NupG family nucleoside CNT transporter n=1 Tax=Pseudalkalibacillus decolorationis TaxID=163879 RepID=UPI00214910AF|nr:NupC/NupG family nucleoside CNT transporter [Pseudalkalibacillus decolorationis]
MDILNVLWGLLGVVVILGIGFLFSNNKKKIKLRPIVGGLVIQILFAFIVLESEIGKQVFNIFADFANAIIGYGEKGIEFLFGGLYTEESNITFVVAFNVLPQIIFFASLISILYYLGIIQVVIKYLGGGMAKLFGTSKEESTSAAANIFVGHTEAPLVIRPFLSKMTNSELFAVMTGGLASVAGTMLAAYASLGIPMDYLLAAMFMAAPSGLVMAKLFHPETETLTSNTEIEFDKSENENLIDVAAEGATNGVKLAIRVGAILITFVALIALVNGFIGYVGGWFGLELSLEKIFGFLLAPLAFAIGVPWSEAGLVGSFIGQKIVLTEFLAYIDFSNYMDTLSEKTIAIVSFALCGFANFSSMGSLIGVVGGIAPNRKKMISKLAFRSVIAGALASLLNASIAGMFF